VSHFSTYHIELNRPEQLLRVELGDAGEAQGPTDRESAVP